MQLSMFHKSVLVDIGPVGSGITTPRFIRADDSLIYVVKDEMPPGGALRADTVRASEFFWLSIAKEIGLPASTPEIIKNKVGRLIVGTRYEIGNQPDVQNILLSGQIVEGSNIITRIYIYDIFIANWDRHPGNYLVLNDGQNQPVVFAIDFSHVAICPDDCVPPQDPALSAQSPTRAHFPQIVAPYGVDRVAAIETIDRLRSLPEATVSSILAAIPTDWLSGNDRQKALNWWSGPARLARADLVEKGVQNGTFI